MTEYIHTMHRVTKVIDNQRKILENISLSFLYGAKIGVLGLNGSGKSTLLRIIAGIDNQFDGEVRVQSGIKIGYLAQNPDFQPDITVRDAIEEGVYDIKNKLRDFDAINAKFADSLTDIEMDALLIQQGNLQTEIEECCGWDLDRRLKIQLGAYYAAVSLFNSNSGIAGAISYPLGAYYNVPHGIAGGMFVVPVVKYNIDAGYYKYAELYDLIEGADQRLSAEQKSKEFLVLLDKLSEKLTVPKKLSIFGIKKENYEHVIEIMQLLQAAFDQNPVHLDVKNTGIILDSFFE